MYLILQSNVSRSPLLRNIFYHGYLSHTKFNNSLIWNCSDNNINKKFSILSQNPVNKKTPSLNNLRNIYVTPIRNGWTKDIAYGNKLWTIEKLVSSLLIGIIPMTIAYPSQAGDYLLAGTVMMHSHWGMEAVLLDYVRSDNFGQTITKCLHWILLAITGATLSGLFYFIYNDIGLTKSIHKIWMLKPKTNNIEAIAN